MGARQHRQRGMRVRHRAQGLDQPVHAGQQHAVARLAQHQRVAEVVDVLAGAGEMHEFQRGAQLRVVLQPFLDQVLDRLDVVVGGAFDLLDPRRIDHVEVPGERMQARLGAAGELRQLDDARLRGQRQQPFDLDLDPGADQAVLGEDRPQRVDLAGVTAVERGQGEQLGVGHGAAGRRRDARF